MLEVGRYSESDVEPPGAIGHTTECISGFIKKGEQIWLLLDAGSLNQGVNLPPDLQALEQSLQRIGDGAVPRGEQADA